MSCTGRPRTGDGSAGTTSRQACRPFLAAAAILTSGVLSSAAQAEDAPSPEEFSSIFRGVAEQHPTLRPLPLTIIINGKAEDQPSLVALRGRSIWVRQTDVAGWGLQSDVAPQAAVLTADGVPFIDLAAIEGLSVHLDADVTTLEVVARPELFGTRRYSPVATQAVMTEAVPAFFLEYDLSVTGLQDEVQAAGWVDVGVSGPWGVIGTTALANIRADASGRSVVRLDTTFQHDFVQSDLRLVLGDTQTSAGSTNRSVLYAGIRLGRDFAFDPQAITMPLPSIIGATVLPSTVELVSAGAQQSFQTDRGQFLFDFIPQFTGAGQVTMNIRDLAGNVSQITQNFYTGRDLLQPGLETFSLEAGFLRKDYGLRSFAYGAPFAAASWRRGITPWLTMNGRVEASSAIGMVGIGANLIAGALGELGFSAAASQSRGEGDGALLRVSARRVTPQYAISAGYEYADGDFRQVGDDRRSSGARSEFTASGSVNMPSLGSVNAGFVHSRRADSTFDIGSIFWSATLSRVHASLGGQLTRSSTAEQSRLGYGLFASATVSLGKRRIASLTVDRNRIAASFEQSPPVDRGLGYHLLTGRDLHGGGMWTEAGLEWRSGLGDLNVIAQNRSGQNSLGLSVHGALIAADGVIAAMPRLDYGFALIDLPGATEVTLSVENRPTAATVGAGAKAIISGLQPFAPNRVSIDPDALPIEQVLSAPEIIVVPGWRQVARVHFDPAGGYHPVRLKLVDEAGAAIAPGSRVELADGATSVVGYDGHVYLPDGDTARLAPLKVLTSSSPCEALVPAIAADAHNAPAPVVTCTTPQNRN